MDLTTTDPNDASYTKIHFGGKFNWMRVKPGMEKAAAFLETHRYAALIGGCRNSFVERMLRPLHDRITLLRITSMSQPKRINKSLREVTAIWRAIRNGDPDLAERCCVDHVRAAAVAALSMIERSSAPKNETISSE